MKRIRLPDYGYWTVFFSAIGLPEYQISDWQIRETIGLWDIRSRLQSIDCLIPDSEKMIGCPSLIISTNTNTIPRTALRSTLKWKVFIRSELVNVPLRHLTGQTPLYKESNCKASSQVSLENELLNVSSILI